MELNVDEHISIIGLLYNDNLIFYTYIIYNIKKLNRTKWIDISNLSVRRNVACKLPYDLGHDNNKQLQ